MWYLLTSFLQIKFKSRVLIITTAQTIQIVIYCSGVSEINIFLRKYLSMNNSKMIIIIKSTFYDYKNIYFYGN